MKTKIVFLFTLLALAPIIHGRHTSSNHRYEKLDESKPVELVEPEELEELKDPEELEDQEELEDLEEVEEFEGPPPEETEESSAEELSEGGVCSVEAEDRNDCGWIGIDNTTCENRGCCYDETVSDAAWCFYPTDNKCYGIDPVEREDCGHSGIQREECENDRGCCFDHTVPNVPWCFKGTEPPAKPANDHSTLGDICDVESEDRNDCGWYGIDEATCEARGCCYDDTKPKAKWCFYPTDNKCYGIKPQEREDCGYIGIQREECENDRGCCFDHTVQGVPWCFKATGPVSVAPPEVETQEGSAGASEA
ncbi:putative gastrointestinal growth factor xP4 isoform X2 [Pocillopora damicornis]|uniref:putative gastrointestinal growth factor xP4 isoform X2 n=1 Tax=Pocillopora damicornis TaxID=46731 RepID=UPI000F559879|nr:putative gastrointestinal growth factor xP4 isoform X2 [Pocillopora damicornis]